MNADRIANIFGGVIIIGILTTVLARPNTVQVIRATGDAFSGSIRAAMGSGVRF